MFSLRGCYNVAIPYVAILHVAISHVTHGKLHETCMFNATRKRGPRKHVMGMHCSFLVAPCVDTQVKNEVKIEWYRICHCLQNF